MVTIYGIASVNTEIRDKILGLRRLLWIAFHCYQWLQKAFGDSKLKTNVLFIHSFPKVSGRDLSQQCNPRIKQNAFCHRTAGTLPKSTMHALGNSICSLPEIGLETGAWRMSRRYFTCAPPYHANIYSNTQSIATIVNAQFLPQFTPSSSFLSAKLGRT